MEWYGNEIRNRGVGIKAEIFDQPATCIAFVSYPVADYPPSYPLTAASGIRA